MKTIHLTLTHREQLNTELYGVWPPAVQTYEDRKAARQFAKHKHRGSAREVMVRELAERHRRMVEIREERA